jgi:hypothetical protein
MHTTHKRAFVIGIALFLGLAFLVLGFVFAPLHHYSSIGLYPNGQAGSITQGHAIAPKTFLQLDLSSSRQVCGTLLSRKDIDLPDFIAVHVTCPTGQRFSLVTLEYRIDRDWIVHPSSLQLETGLHLTEEPYDTFICVVPISDCRLPPMKSLEDVVKVHHITIRATVKNTSDPNLPTYSAQEDFVLSTFKQNSPLWWSWVRF